MHTDTHTRTNTHTTCCRLASRYFLTLCFNLFLKCKTENSGERMHFFFGYSYLKNEAFKMSSKFQEGHSKLAKGSKALHSGLSLWSQTWIPLLTVHVLEDFTRSCNGKEPTPAKITGTQEMGVQSLGWKIFWSRNGNLFQYACLETFCEPDPMGVSRQDTTSMSIHTF